MDKQTTNEQEVPSKAAKRLFFNRPLIAF